MKILLIGEYSRLHNSLKEGLAALGHEVIIVGTGDNFKKFSVDHSVFPKITSGTAVARKIKNAIYKLTGYDLAKAETAWHFKALLQDLQGYDHVQLINSDALEIDPKAQQRLYKKLFSQNKQSSLLICGDETPVIDCLLKNELKYSILSPYLADNNLKNYFSYSLKYTTPPYRSLFEWVQNNVTSIITSDLDYKIPMDRMGIVNTLIPNPINTDKIARQKPGVTGKIVIFLGINRLSAIKKGTAFFEQALEIIRKKYPEKVEVIITENLPYAEYLQRYERAHILLDYVYGYDQGYNALEAMAAGKVVFTGAEAEFMQHYNLTQRVAINALPDVDQIVTELSFLIDNPHQIEAISQRARAFIEQEHHYIKIAEKYLQTWGLIKT